MDALENGRQRTIYLITYSRADMTKFSCRQSFSSAVVEAWESCRVRVLQWVTCIEGHTTNDSDSTSSEMNLYHFHMAIKLAKKARWMQVKNYLAEKFGIQVNFSDNHSTYYSAYRYVTKDDTDVLHSFGHPDLSDAAPRTEVAIGSRKKKARARATGEKRKRSRAERLSIFDVCQIAQNKRITSRLQLVNLAVQQNREGKSSLAQFIANRGNKAVDDALTLAKEFSEAEAISIRASKTRLEILEEECGGECVPGCNARWQEAASQVLQRHGIIREEFCEAIYIALTKGRGKYRNIFIHGNTNCGKSFIVSPLKVIYKAFCNPATGSFAWIGAENAEIIFLNDFRWHPKIIAWADFLQALEGDTVHLPAPKNISNRDVELKKDTPFFATSDAPLVLIKAGGIDNTNTQMMNVRWRFFHFWRQIPVEEQQELLPCGHCFAKFILENRARCVTAWS